jgi:predicted Rossmann fold flavoprotein
MAAAAAAGSGRSVLLIEHLSEPGRKLLATGGGRCNVTTTAPVKAILDAFGRRGRFAEPALRAFGPESLRGFLDASGVPTVAEPDGCVFPVSQRAQDVLVALRRAAHAARVCLRCRCRVSGIRVHDGAVSGAITAAGHISASTVVLCAGGCAMPGLGSDGSGFSIAAAAGHTVVTPVPALVPLVTVEDWPRRLSGLTLADARVRIDLPGCSRTGLSGTVLFTHRGLSGPAVLNLSGEVAAHLAAGEPVTLCLRIRADRDAAAWMERFGEWRRAGVGGRALQNLLSGDLPRPLAATLCALAGEIGSSALCRARGADLTRLAGLCADVPIAISATEGWSRAMVTRGGVSLDEIDPQTLASRLVRGLCFAGELIDLDGPCGGYNLTWAFASGRLAGQSAATVG